MIRLPSGRSNFPLLQSVQTGPGAHSASHWLGIRGTLLVLWRSGC